MQALNGINYFLSHILYHPLETILILILSLIAAANDCDILMKNCCSSDIR